ncbi:MAG: molybdenum cofactor guanylyltransferase [Sandarakinorhabdus sp.]|nr:molybdenum cofactor guanylyltransferase [Sandarakinorhabdus sp.]
MRILGAVLAGGASARFGSDKAMAEFAGKPLIEHVIAALAPQVETLVVVGRDWPGHARVDDLPAPGLGPIGGLAGALGHALLNGYDAVLVAPCDTLGLAADLVARLSPGPAVAMGQRSVGLWPSSLAPALIARLSSGDSRALHIWVDAAEAREVDCGALHNINHPDDIG